MMATVPHEIKKIFQSQKDRLRNADEPHMMRPKLDLKPLKGLARTLYLSGQAKLQKANSFADSGFRSKTPVTPVKKEKDNEELKKKYRSK